MFHWFHILPCLIYPFICYYFSTTVPVSFRWDEAIISIAPLVEREKSFWKLERVISLSLRVQCLWWTSRPTPHTLHFEKNGVCWLRPGDCSCRTGKRQIVGRQPWLHGSKKPELLKFRQICRENFFYRKILAVSQTLDLKFSEQLSLH